MIAVKFICYVFVNSKTGNVIGYRSLPSDMVLKERDRALELERMEISVRNRLMMSSVYWKVQEPICL
jgi:hypothetical protein